jgi:hypothetical protein
MYKTEVKDGVVGWQRDRSGRLALLEPREPVTKNNTTECYTSMALVAPLETRPVRSRDLKIRSTWTW